jgi:hypothetical protein
MAAFPDDDAGKAARMIAKPSGSSRGDLVTFMEKLNLLICGERMDFLGIMPDVIECSKV